MPNGQIERVPLMLCVHGIAIWWSDQKQLTSN